LIGVLNAILILSDSKYEGWQPGKKDLLDIQMGLLCFVDKYGRRSLKEVQWFEEDEEGEADSCRSTSVENTPSPQSVPSVERSISGSSSNDPSAGSPDSAEEAASNRASPSTSAVNEDVSASVQPGFILGTSGGPPPPGGRFFNNPANIRTLMTGSGDGYRSPEPPSRIDILPPLRERAMAGGDPRNSGFHQSGMVTERTGQSFSDSPGPGMEHGCGSQPPLSSSLVLPAELMVYNELMMDISTGQYLGAEMQELVTRPFIHPSVSANDDGGVNGFGADGNPWQGMVHEPWEGISSFGYPQPCQPDHTSGPQTGGNFGPTGGTIDYK
jgi:hypothetical protein